MICAVRSSGRTSVSDPCPRAIGERAVATRQLQATLKRESCTGPPARARSAPDAGTSPPQAGPPARRPSSRRAPRRPRPRYRDVRPPARRPSRPDGRAVVNALADRDRVRRPRAVQGRGQQGVGRMGVARRRRWNWSSLNISALWRTAAEQGRRGHGAPAGLDDRDRLRGGELAGQAPRDVRSGGRAADRAEVGQGHDHAGPWLASPGRHRPVAHDARVDPVRDVVGADDDHRPSRRGVDVGDLRRSVLDSAPTTATLVTCTAGGRSPRWR